MRLRQIFDILKNTELKQIIVGENDDQVISLLNLALIEVYGKFAILQEEHNIVIEPGVTRYRLPQNTQKVLQAYWRNTKKHPLTGYDDFTEIPINDINCKESIFTPQPYLVHIPNPFEGRVYSLMIIVSPPYVTKENIDTLEFFVPDQYLEPIVNYAAYRAYKSMNGDENTEIGSHYKFYMMSCNEVYKKGLAQTNPITNLKLEERGF